MVLGHLGLFRAAILQSGSAFAPWAMQHSPLQEAKKLALQCNCPTAKTRDMVDCLRTADVQNLLPPGAVSSTIAKVCFEFI